MYDARQFDTVRRPVTEAETLPPSCYTDDAFYRLEREHIFLKKWILIGRTDEWPKPGDYQAFERFGIPFIVARDERGDLHAFNNSCRHRGAQIVQGKGNCRNFVCPYHSWVFALDGRLQHSVGMEETKNFDAADYGLHAIHLEVWNTFVFVNFSRDCGPLEAQLGDLGRHLDGYDFSNVATVGRREWIVEANWKNYVENSMEWLHHPTVHRASILGRVAKITRNIVYGEPGDYVMVQSRADGVSRAVMGDAKSFPPLSFLTGAARNGSQYALVYPFSMIGCDVDSVWYKQMIPEGANKVRNIATFCFHREVRERSDFDEIAPNYYKRFETVVEEDNAAMAIQFAGLRSPFAQQGRFSTREILAHHIDNWILDQVVSRNT